MEDDIVILDEGVAHPGVERLRAHTLKRAADLTAKSVVMEPAIVEVPEPPKPVLYGQEGQPGHTMYVADTVLYYNSGSNHVVGYAKYSYFDGYSHRVHTPAATMWHGNVKVFALREADLDVFRQLLLTYDVRVGAGKHLLFFMGEPCEGRHVRNQASDCVGLYWDGMNLTFSQSDNAHYTLRSGSPITKSAEGFFKEVSTFIGKTTKTVRAQLEGHKRDLDDVKKRRSEDAFLYLQDLEPSPDKADIHAFVVSKLEGAYTEDQQLAQSHEVQALELAQKIKDARSQFPSGRRGVAIKAGYLTSPVLTELLESFTLYRNGAFMTLTFAFKKELIVEEIFYGRPVIEMGLVVERAGGRDSTHIQKVTATSMDLRAFMHPHLEGQTRWCLGTYITAMNNAFLGGNLPLLTALIWEYLNRYNEDSPLVNLDTCRTQMDAARPRDIVVRRK